jgi:hypothetical protein
VITFKNPYLGNTCVPFQHWACSIDCAKALEIPARIEQIAAAQELDRQYEKYIDECQRKFHATARPMVLCVRAGSPNQDQEGQGQGQGQAQRPPGQVVPKGQAQGERSQAHKVSAPVLQERRGTVPGDATHRGCECVVS